MRTSHALLLRLYHDPQYDFNKVRVDYINRGAPEDRSTVSGERIDRLGAGGMEIESATGKIYIPYHRILLILYDGNLYGRRALKRTSVAAVSRQKIVLIDLWMSIGLWSQTINTKMPLG